MKTIDTTEVFDEWFGSLKDKPTASRIQARIDRAEEGNFGDHKAVWVRAYPKYASTLGLGFAFISLSAVWKS